MRYKQIVYHSYACLYSLSENGLLPKCTYDDEMSRLVLFHSGWMFRLIPPAQGQTG